MVCTGSFLALGDGPGHPPEQLDSGLGRVAVFVLAEVALLKYDTRVFGQREAIFSLGSGRVGSRRLHERLRYPAAQLARGAFEQAFDLTDNLQTTFAMIRYVLFLAHVHRRLLLGVAVIRLPKIDRSGCYSKIT